MTKWCTLWPQNKLLTRESSRVERVEIHAIIRLTTSCGGVIGSGSGWGWAIDLYLLFGILKWWVYCSVHTLHKSTISSCQTWWPVPRAQSTNSPEPCKVRAAELASKAQLRPAVSVSDSPAHCCQLSAVCPTSSIGQSAGCQVGGFLSRSRSVSGVGYRLHWCCVYFRKPVPKSYEF